MNNDNNDESNITDSKYDELLKKYDELFKKIQELEERVRWLEC